MPGGSPEAGVTVVWGRVTAAAWGSSPQPALPALPFRCSSSCSVRYSPVWYFRLFLPSPFLPLHQAPPPRLPPPPHWCPTSAGQPCSPGHLPGSAIGACALAQQGLILGMVVAILGVPLGSFSPSTLGRWESLPLPPLWGRLHILCHCLPYQQRSYRCFLGWDVQRTVTHPFKGTKSMVSKQVPWIRASRSAPSSGSASYWLYALGKFLHFCLLVYKLRILF